MFAAIDARGLDPKQHGTGWQSRCPAHDDTNPSFSFGPGEKGGVLVKCHTGCSFEAIVAGTGLPEAAFFAEKNGHAPKKKEQLRFVEQWEIKDEHGVTLAVKKKFLRPNDKKTFLLYLPDGVTPSKQNTPDHIAPADLPLYGAHRLDRTRPVFVVEGEAKCDALHQAGWNAVGTVTGGSSCPRKERLALLDGLDVVLWPDHDKVGFKHVAAMGAILRTNAATLRLIEWTTDNPVGAPREGDDAKDFLARGGNVQQLLNDAHPFAAPASPEQAALQEPHTDLGLARRFHALHQAEFRYLADAEEWVRWDNRCWRPDTTNRVVYTLSSLARGVHEAQTNDDDRKAAQRMEQRPRILGAEGLARSLDVFATTSEQFDANPNLLQCANGVVDLATGAFRQSNPKDLLLKRLPFAYDPQATCPRWTAFIEEITAGRADMATFLQRFAGYCLTTDTSEHALLLAVGEGRNGKSTFVETLMFVLGDEFSAASPPGLLLATKFQQHPTEIMALKGKRLVVVSEVPKSGAFAEERVKWMTGGDQLSGRGMRQDFDTFRASHKFIVCANHMPKVADASDGFWRRVLVAEFTVSFKGREDHTLTATLQAEAQGILTWLVQGCLAWRSQGLARPASVTQATAKYQSGEDQVGRFLEGYEIQGEVPLKDIYAALKLWCEQNGERTPKGGKELSHELEQHGFESRHTKKGNLWHRVVRQDPDVSDHELWTPPPEYTADPDGEG